MACQPDSSGGSARLLFFFFNTHCVGADSFTKCLQEFDRGPTKGSFLVSSAALLGFRRCLVVVLLFVYLIPPRFQPRSAQLCPVQQAWQTADAVRRLVRAAPLHSRKSHLSPEACVVWLLSTTMYTSLQEVTCLPVFVFFELVFLSVCRTRCLVCVSSRCFKACRGALPRVSCPLYLQSPHNVRFRLFVSALVPSRLGLRSDVLISLCFIASY
jgi:hypothetical protein